MTMLKAEAETLAKKITAMVKLWEAIHTAKEVGVQEAQILELVRFAWEGHNPFGSEDDGQEFVRLSQ